MSVTHPRPMPWTGPSTHCGKERARAKPRRVPGSCKRAQHGKKHLRHMCLPQTGNKFAFWGHAGVDFCFWVDQISASREVHAHVDLLLRFDPTPLISRRHLPTPIKADGSRGPSVHQPHWPRPVEKHSLLSADLVTSPHHRPTTALGLARVCSSRILLWVTVSSSFPSAHLWWTRDVGPSAVFVFGVFSVSKALLCYRKVPSGQGRK